MGCQRLAATLAVAGRDNGFPAKARRKIVLAAAEGYRIAMRAFAEQPLLAVWYAHLDIEPALSELRSQMDAKRFKATEKLLAKAHTSDRLSRPSWPSTPGAASRTTRASAWWPSST